MPLTGDEVIFLAIMLGCASGGVAYARWSRRRLERQTRDKPAE